MELVSVFTAPPMVKVVYGRQELGEVHELTFAIGDQQPTLLTLGGRNWSTRYVDWPRRRAFVEPTDMKGRSQWLSMSQPMHFTLCQSIEAVLTTNDQPQGLSHRAIEILEQLREEFEWADEGTMVMVIDNERNATCWTFAGLVFNAAMANALECQAEKVSSNNLSLTFNKIINIDELKSKIRLLLKNGGGDDVYVPLDAKFIQELKFSECLPQQMIDEEMASRYSVAQQFHGLRQKSLVSIVIR